MMEMFPVLLFCSCLNMRAPRPTLALCDVTECIGAFAALVTVKPLQWLFAPTKRLDLPFVSSFKLWYGILANYFDETATSSGFILDCSVFHSPPSPELAVDLQWPARMTWLPHLASRVMDRVAIGVFTVVTKRSVRQLD